MGTNEDQLNHLSSLIKIIFEQFVQKHWLKVINKEAEKCLKLQRDLRAQRMVVNALLAAYKEKYGEDLRKGESK